MENVLDILKFQDILYIGFLMFLDYYVEGTSIYIDTLVPNNHICKTVKWFEMDEPEEIQDSAEAT